MSYSSLRLSLAAPAVAILAVLVPATSALATPVASPTSTPSPSTWAKQTSPTQVNLHGIFAFDSCHVWAVGEEAPESQVASSRVAASPLAQAVVLTTTDGGKTWTPQSFPTTAALNTTMNRVFFTDVTHGYAAGENNDLPLPSPSPSASPSATQTPLVGGNRGNAALQTLGPNFLSTSDGGATWTDLSANLPAGTKTTPSSDNEDAADIEGLTAVGDKVWIATSQSSGGLIAYSPDRGVTWTIQVNSGATGFASVSMFDELHGFAVDDASTIFYTSTGGIVTNHGTGWQRVQDLNSRPEGVWATSATSAVVAEEGGLIEYTTDSAATMHSATINGGVSESDLDDVAFGSALNGVVAGELGGPVLWTTDGGLTWDKQSVASNTENFKGVTMARGTTVSFAAGDGGTIAGNTDPSVGCVAAGQLPVNASATPKLPAAGISAVFQNSMGIGFLLSVLMGLGLGARAIAQRIRSRS